MNDEDRKQLSGKADAEVVMPVPASIAEMPDNYEEMLATLKQKIVTAQLKTLHTANIEMMTLYWHIGQEILTRQHNQSWGAKVIDRLAYDLKTTFPDVQGFSARNLKYMRKFADSWPDLKLVQRCAALIPWRSNQVLLDKIKEPDQRKWYALQTLNNGWSRDILVFQIESGLYQRQGESQNNFPNTLPPVQSDMAAQLFKDPYIFDFVSMDATYREAELEASLLKHMEKFLLELGQGFAFVGRQVQLNVAGEEFYADLLFYHLRLRCFVVVELKTGKFQPAYISQLNLYQSIIDQKLRHQDDQQTIGLLLVKEKNTVVVEYALASNNKPTGVAEWQHRVVTTLPDELKSDLPTIEQIERELINKKLDE